MTRPTARVLSLLELLQSGGVRTVAELAGRLGVDERTVRRYAGHLLDLDVPVESVRGRYGGYRLASGYRMPPLMLSDDEAVARWCTRASRLIVAEVYRRELIQAAIDAKAASIEAEERRIASQAPAVRLTSL